MQTPKLLSHLLCLLIVILFSQQTKAQTEKKHDIVLKNDGEEMKGDVTAISDSTITFNYAGEKLVYIIKKADLSKITFASGRVQTFNKPAAIVENRAPVAQPETASNKEDRRNKVAILPFSFVKDGQPAAQEVSEEIQSECYAMLNKHAGVYEIVSPRAINVKLSKAGISRVNILNYSMSELCETLGVEYILDGMVTQNRTTQTSYGNSTYTNKENENDKSGKKKGSGTSSTYATNLQNYQTVMDMKIYNDKSEVIYNQNRKAFWNTEDAYKNTMEYLIKRSPIYNK
ncbi:hypothetical protein SAMN05428949_2323 [Chitinophaga sp. YR627]|nr:hypothetical protein SAMN05428949_2323 [Chitinophaga sp. YR627]